MGSASQIAQTTHGRYAATPRTLIFVTHGGDVLLVRGAPHKGWWAGRLNGVGGHIERDEDVWTSARRELREEVGLELGAAGPQIHYVIPGTPPTEVTFR